jgi:hypothetical protein
MLDVEEMGKGAACRLITSSLRLIMNYTSTIPCADYLDLEQSAKNPTSKPSGCWHPYPRTSLSTLLGIPC